MNALWTRRSVRQFQDKPIEPEQLELLLRAAMQAPSAANQRPWQFLVVQNRETLRRLSCLSEYAGCLAKAACAVLILKDGRDLPWPRSADQDLGACTMALLTEAAELGLGGVWLGAAPYEDRMERARRMFDFPPGLEVYSVIALGHPLRADANHAEDRYEPSRVHYETY